MGLLSTYLAVQFGKKRAKQKMAQEFKQAGGLDSFDVCDYCGYELHRHSPDSRLKCPNYGM